MSLSLLNEFSSRLEEIVNLYNSSPTGEGIAVAYSGGLDSSALLSLAHNYCLQKNLRLCVFHVHHGLSLNANMWLRHCQITAEVLDRTFDSASVQIDQNDKSGIEASARGKRYRALSEMCRKHNVSFLLTAHHQDDQAETALLQLLRGSGVAGLSGMECHGRMPKLLGTDSIVLIRPLLDFSRAQLFEYAAIHELKYVEDESNSDVRFLRNALRHRVMPAIADIAPGFAARVTRSVKHAKSAQRMLLELAQEDLDRCAIDEALDLSQMSALSDDRIDNLFRFWLSVNDVRTPTTSRLSEIRKQLFGAKDDARISVIHDGIRLHRYEAKVYIDRNFFRDGDAPAPESFCWNGEPVIFFPRFHGALHFDPASSGISAESLMRMGFVIKLRQGGERLKLAANRSTRDIKYHYQALRIPFWKRMRLPFVWHGDDLVFAAEVGVSHQFLGDSGHCISIRWEFNNN